MPSARPTQSGKNDQYVSEDTSHDSSGARHELHKRLYPAPSAHPGEVYYIVVCRTCLGFPVRTSDGRSAIDSDKGQRPSIFPPHTKKELNKVPGVKPPTVYHSLIAQNRGQGGSLRYREFMIYHDTQIYPEYVLAYKRVERT